MILYLICASWIWWSASALVEVQVQDKNGLKPFFPFTNVTLQDAWAISAPRTIEPVQRAISLHLRTPHLAHEISARYSRDVMPPGATVMRHRSLLPHPALDTDLPLINTTMQPSLWWESSHNSQCSFSESFSGFVSFCLSSPHPLFSFFCLLLLLQIFCKKLACV